MMKHSIIGNISIALVIGCGLYSIGGHKYRFRSFKFCMRKFIQFYAQVLSYLQYLN